MPKARNALIKICNKNVNQVNFRRMGKRDCMILLAPYYVLVFSQRKTVSSKQVREKIVDL